MSVGIGIMSLRYKQKRQTRRAKKSYPIPGSNIQAFFPDDLSNSLKGKDFYKFVNTKWLQSVHVPPHISSYSVSEEVEQSIQLNLQSILRKCIETSKKSNEASIERAVGLVSQSALNAKVQQKSVKSLQKILNDLRCMRDVNDIGRTLGEFVKYKIPGIFWLFSQYENQNHTKYTYTIAIGKVGLPDISYYKKTAPGKSKTLLKYANLLQQVGKLFDIPNLSSIVPTEELLASAIQKSLSEKQFQRKGSDLANEFHNIPFETIFTAIGIDSWKTETFFVDSKNWLKTLEKMFQYLSLDLWRLLLSTELLLHFLPYLPPPYDDLYFSFFHKYLRGQTEKVPQRALTIGIVEEWMTPFFSKLYLEYNPSQEIKSQATDLTKELLVAAKGRLKQVNWLQPSTKEKAIEKVEKMLLSIGYPDTFSKLSIPEVKSDNLLENLLTLGSWQTEYERKRLGEKRNDQKDWDDPVFAVNAYYYSQSNEIVIPLGSLYWPFFRSGAPLGWNYGGLGCIIGHELTHAFDKEGKEYNPDGFPQKWWSSTDNRAFTKKSKSLIQLFNQQKILDHPVNGALTLSENIADLGGLAIALDALRMKLEKEKLDEKEKKKAYQQFFISYAVSWRVKEKPEKVLQSLFLDHHAPASMRVNLVVSQFQEWYDAFDISEKDLMYIPSDKRIRIF